MNDFQRHLAERLETDPEFREIWEKNKPRRAFQHAIIKARIDAGLTQEELAERMGVSQSTVARIERGPYLPSLETAQRLADALGVELTIAPGKPLAVKPYEAA